VLAYGFTENCQFWGNNWSKLCISWSLHSYYGLAIHNSPIYEFLQVLKKFNFHSKSIGISIRFYRKLSVWGQNWPKLHISWSWPHIGDRLYRTVLYMSFYGFWKNSKFYSTISVSLRFYRKSPVWGKNWPRLHMSWLWPYIVDQLSITVPYMNFYMF
jgi:hypothetical protein